MPKERYLDLLLREYGENAKPIASVREIVRDSLSGEKIDVYYPGIGGTGEPLDLFWPFHWLDANTVYGVDLFSQRHANSLNACVPIYADFEFWFELLQRQLRQDVSPVSSHQTDLQWTGLFRLDGIDRQIVIPKVSIDARTFTPEGSSPIIFSRRTIGVLSNLPKIVLEKAKVIFFEAEAPPEAKKVARHLSARGFQTLDPGFTTQINKLFVRS